jgi:hypothetical protein
MTIIFLLASFLALSGNPPAGFVPVLLGQTVSVYRRPSGPGVELYAEGDIAAPPSKVRDVLLDYEQHPNFVKDLAESHVLRREDSALWVYQRLDLPLLADRDFTLKVTWGSDGDVLWTHFACDNSRGPPPQSGKVRVVRLARRSDRR